MPAALAAICLFYAAYFAGMGLMLPYFPLYLAARDFDAVQVGLLVGALSLAKVVAPPLAGLALDRKGGGRRFVAASMLAAALCMLVLPAAGTFAAVLLFVAIFGLLWAAALPAADGLSVAVSEAALADYGRLRVWGSIGFVVATLGGGVLLADVRVYWLPAAMAVLLFATSMSALRFPAPPPPDRRPSGAGKRGAWFALLATSFIMQASHGAYYGFYSLHLSALGFAGWQIGAFWTLGVVAEIVLMWGWSRPFAQAAPAWVLGGCLLLASLRWLGIGLSQAWWALACWQLLHAASFAAFHINAVTWVRRLAPAGRQVSAQGWYSASGFGLGTSVGVMACGWIIDQAGFTSAFYACAVIALAGLLPALRLPKKP